MQLQIAAGQEYINICGHGNNVYNGIYYKAEDWFGSVHYAKEDCSAHLFYHTTEYWELDYRCQDGTHDWYEGGYKKADDDILSEIEGDISWSNGNILTFTISPFTEQIEASSFDDDQYNGIYYRMEDWNGVAHFALPDCSQHLYYHYYGYWQIDNRDQDGSNDWDDGGYIDATNDYFIDLIGERLWSSQIDMVQFNHNYLNEEDITIMDPSTIQECTLNLYIITESINPIEQQKMCGENFLLPEYTCAHQLDGIVPCSDIAITNMGDSDPLFDIQNLIYQNNKDEVGKIRWINLDDCNEEVRFYATIQITTNDVPCILYSNQYYTLKYTPRPPLQLCNPESTTYELVEIATETQGDQQELQWDDYYLIPLYLELQQNHLKFYAIYGDTAYLNDIIYDFKNQQRQIRCDPELLVNGECFHLYYFYIVFKVNNECLLYSAQKILQYCDQQCINILPFEMLGDGNQMGIACSGQPGLSIKIDQQFYEKIDGEQWEECYTCLSIISDIQMQIERLDDYEEELQIIISNDQFSIKLDEIPSQLPIEFEYKIIVTYNEIQVTSGIYKWNIKQGNLECPCSESTVIESEPSIQSDQEISPSEENDSLSLTDISINDNPWVFLPNRPPEFLSDLQPQTIYYNSTVQEFGTNKTYILPEIYDPNNDTYTLTFINLPTFMIYDIDKNTIVYQYDLIQQEDLQENIIEIQIEDIQGGVSKYYLNVTVINNQQIPVFQQNLLIQFQNQSGTDSLQTSIRDSDEDLSEIEEDEENIHVSAKIDSVNAIGEMKIKFSENMFTDFNYSIIDNSFIEMYIIPSQMRIEDDEEEVVLRENERMRELQTVDEYNLNFTWNVTNFEDDTLDILLHFNNPLKISQYEIQDEIYISFTEDASSLFYSDESTPTSKKILETRYLQKRICRQLENNEINNNIKSASEAGLISIEALLIISVILNLMLNDLALNYMLTMIHALQIVIHLPIIRIYIQANLNMVFSIIIPIVMFDILDSEYLSELMLEFDFDNQQQLTENQYGQIVDLGYTSHNSIINLGTLSIVFIFYFIRLFWLLMLIIYTKVTNKYVKIHSYKDNLRKTLLFGELIKIFIEGYFEFLISCFFAIKMPLMTSSGEITSVLIGYFGIVIALFLPLILIFILLILRIEQLKEPKIRATLGTLYEGLKMNNKQQLAYYLIFLLRRISYVSVVLLYLESGCIQLIFIMLINLSIVIYQGGQAPLNSKFRNQIELINEIFIMTITICFTFMTDWIDISEIQYNMGWLISVIFGFLIAINLVIIIYFSLKQSYLVYIKWRAIIKRYLENKFPKYWKKKDDKLKNKSDVIAISKKKTGKNNIPIQNTKIRSQQMQDEKKKESHNDDIKENNDNKIDLAKTSELFPFVRQVNIQRIEKGKMSTKKKKKINNKDNSEIQISEENQDNIPLYSENQDFLEGQDDLEEESKVNDFEKQTYSILKTKNNKTYSQKNQKMIPIQNAKNYQNKQDLSKVMEVSENSSITNPPKMLSGMNIPKKHQNINQNLIDFIEQPTSPIVYDDQLDEDIRQVYQRQNCKQIDYNYQPDEQDKISIIDIADQYTYKRTEQISKEILPKQFLGLSPKEQQKMIDYQQKYDKVRGKDDQINKRLKDKQVQKKLKYIQQQEIVKDISKHQQKLLLLFLLQKDEGEVDEFEIAYEHINLKQLQFAASNQNKLLTPESVEQILKWNKQKQTILYEAQLKRSSKLKYKSHNIQEEDMSQFTQEQALFIRNTKIDEPFKRKNQFQ